MNKFSALLPFVLAGLWSAGCVNNQPTAITEANPAVSQGIYVLNEGGFGKSNASLSFVIFDSNKVYSDIFFSANARPLGDVANDLVILKDKIFIVVNNSNKIEIISKNTHASVGTMSVPGNSPNKIVIATESKGYISNLYKGTVTVFNPTTYAIVKDGIAVGQNPQGMTVANGKVFVCNSGYGMDSTVSVIDVAGDSVLATITVSRSPTDIAVDHKGNIVVLCNGYTDFSNPANDTEGSIVIINPLTDSVVKTIPLPLSVYGHPNELAVSSKGYGFSIGKNGVLKFETESYTILSSSFIPKQAYSIATDNETEAIYLGDALDYSSNGKVFRYDRLGAVKDSMTVGIIPGTIVVRK